MLKRKLRLAERGDTIIEVMVVLAVLGLAISISYATANTSLLAAREAEESSEATQMLQSQAESLTYLAPFGPPPALNSIFLAAGQQFCISAGVTVKPFPGVDSYPPECIQKGLFKIAVTYQKTADDTFTLTAIWDDVTGQGQAKAKLVYRVHQP